MNPTRTATVMFLRELLRRWRSVTFMLVMPTSYFLVTYLLSDAATVVPLRLEGGPAQVHDRDVKALYLAVLGLSVTGAFAALSTVRGSSAGMRRLRLAGYRARQLLTARLLVLLVITLAATAVFIAIVWPLVPPRAPLGAVLALLEVGLLGVGLGTLLGLLFTREFEAAMIIVALSGIQLAVGRSDSPGAERFLLYTPSVDALKSAMFTSATDTAALAQGLGYLVPLLAASYVVWSLRTRVY